MSATTAAAGAPAMGGARAKEQAKGGIAPAIEALKGKIDSTVAAQLEACIHCGQCAEACHFYLTSGDPRLTPRHKLVPLETVYRRHMAPFSGLARMFALAPADLTRADLEAWAELLYDSCTLCGRCTVVCPMGIDIASLVRLSRAALVAADLVPESMQAAADRAVAQGSPLITEEVMRRVCAAQEKETGIRVPIDKQGAEYMVALSAMEYLNFYEVIGALARIFKAAGIDWTIASKGFEATNIGYQMGSDAIARTLVSRIVDAAHDLGVKYVVSPECGHAYTALNWEGPNMVGRPFDFEVVHILELLDRLVREGRIRLAPDETRRVTYHDPCQISRRGGVIEEPRHLLRALGANFVEMKRHGVANICCGGGGGVSAVTRAEERRIAAFACKKAQIDELGGIEGLVTACANCRNVLEEAIDAWDMELPVLGLTELVAEHLVDEAPAEEAGAPAGAA